MKINDSFSVLPILRNLQNMWNFDVLRFQLLLFPIISYHLCYIIFSFELINCSINQFVASVG